MLFYEVTTCPYDVAWNICSQSTFYQTQNLRSSIFLWWLTIKYSHIQTFQRCSTFKLELNFPKKVVARYRQVPKNGKIEKKTHFYYRRSGKSAPTLSHKNSFLPILESLLRHLTPTTVSFRIFPTYRCNNLKIFRIFLPGFGPQCSTTC